MLQLTNDNYYSLEADREYMSYSQYKNFNKCEARAVARLNGWKEKEKSKSLLLGSFVHSWSEGEEAFKKFPLQTPELFTQKGELKSDFKHGLVMIDTLKNDPLVSLALSGEKEAIVTAEFAGCWWKSKLDVLDRAEGKIVDLKTAKDLYEKVWIEDGIKKQPVTFIQGYGYTGQMALYAEIERLDAKRDTYLDLYMAIVTSQDPPDKIVISFHPNWIMDELAYIQKNMPHILDVKAGRVKPDRCGRCEYCRETKVLDRVIDFDEFCEMVLIGG